MFGFLEVISERIFKMVRKFVRLVFFLIMIVLSILTLVVIPLVWIFMGAAMGFYAYGLLLDGMGRGFLKKKKLPTVYNPGDELH